MSDNISRQAAIDALGTSSDTIYKTIEKGATFPKREWFDGMAYAETVIKNLPSAPLYTDDELQTMQDLEWAQMEKMYELGKEERKKGKWTPKDAVDEWDGGCNKERERFIRDALDKLSSAQLERLSDDDFETIRIHLNAQKERLCNQQRWKEADEYQRIIDRFIAFASAGPNPNTGAWVGIDDFPHQEWECNQCGKIVYTDSETGIEEYEFCPHCGAEMLNAEGDGGAEWVETSGGEHYKCSRCGFLAPYYLSVDREPCEWLSDFCPNCGKLMWRGSE